MALLELRNTPRQDVDTSPANIMFGRQTRSVVPKVINYSAPKNANFEKRQKRRLAIQHQYDKSAKDLPTLLINDRVFFQSPGRKRWIKGKIIRKINTRTYIVEAHNGQTYQRNRVHLRKDFGRHSNHTAFEHDDTLLPFSTNSTDHNTRECTRDTPTTQTHEQYVNTRPTRAQRLPAKFSEYVLY